MLCVTKFEGGSLPDKAVITLSRFDVRIKPAVLYSDVFVCSSVPSYTLDNTLPDI